MRKVIFLIILNFVVFHIVSQNNEYFSKVEDSINKISSLIVSSINDNDKYLKNDLLKDYLFTSLLKEKSFNYKFDSLKYLKVLQPEDNSFRIFTWTLKNEDGVYENFGYIQKYNETKKNYIIYTLNDKSELYASSENSIGDAENWFGAVYYKIIATKYNNTIYYTLLGWDGNNKYKQRKVIEVLTFKGNNKPNFGSKIFKKYKNKNAARIVFEYSTTSVLNLKFDTQFYQEKTKKRDPITKQYIMKGIKSDMIVFDRLSPLNESLKDVYEYYVAESNEQDGFIDVDGKWVFFENIDARNKTNLDNKNNKNKFIKKKLYTPL